MLDLPTYCCEHRMDAGNRLPLCEGEVDFTCEVPNVIDYQIQILIDKRGGLSIVNR